MEVEKDPSVYNDYAEMGKLDNQRIFMQLGIHALYKYEENNNFLVQLNQNEIDRFTNQKVKLTTN